jgi:hypothetical protein
MNYAKYLPLAVLVVTACPAAAWADEAEDAFNALYGAELKKVAATRDTADDLALAAQFLAAAKAPGTHPGMVVILCEKAHDLGAKAASGFEAAVEAMKLLAQKSPAMAPACLDKIVVVRQRQYDAAKDLERVKAGTALVEALLAAADAKGEAGAAADAAALARRAQTVAAAVAPDRKAEVQARTDRLAWRQRMRNRAAELKVRLQANPQDAASRKELVRILVVDLDDPAQATPLLDETCDEAMRKYVPAAAKKVADAPEQACMELAEWYRGLSDGASPAAKPAMLERARGYYARFLELHAADDVQRSQAALAKKKVDELLLKFGAGGAKGSWAVIGGQWIDLLSALDASRLPPGAKRTDLGLALARDVFKGITFPCMPEGSYQISVKFVRTSGKQGVGVRLPVGASAVSLRLGAADEITMLEGLSTGAVSGGESRLSDNREYTFEVTVLLKGDQADIAATLDGKPNLRWQGAQSAATGAGADGRDIKCLGLGKYPESDITVRSARVRMLAGKATMLVPGS